MLEIEKQESRMKDWLLSSDEHVVLRVVFLENVAEAWLDLPFASLDKAEEAAQDIENAGIETEKIFPEGGPVRIKCHLVAYTRIFTDCSMY